MQEIEISFDGDLNLLKGKTIDLIINEDYIDLYIPKGEENEEMDCTS